MPQPTLNQIAPQIARLLEGGHRASAERFLADTVWDLVRVPYTLNTSTNYLVHYTSIDTLFSLLCLDSRPPVYFPLSFPHSRARPSADVRYLRLYDTYHSNDPNEGRFFVHADHSSHVFSTSHSSLWSLLQSRTTLPAYVTSFRALSCEEDADNLLFWRIYGREGKGCAIVFPVDFLQDYPPLQVHYGSRAVIATLDHLTAVFDYLATTPILREFDLLSGDGAVPPPYVPSSLSPIPYLHKGTSIYSPIRLFRLQLSTREVASWSGCLVE